MRSQGGNHIRGIYCKVRLRGGYGPTVVIVSSDSDFGDRIANWCLLEHVTVWRRRLYGRFGKLSARRCIIRLTYEVGSGMFLYPSPCRVGSKSEVLRLRFPAWEG